MIGTHADLPRAERIAVWVVLVVSVTLAVLGVVVTLLHRTEPLAQHLSSVFADVAAVTFPATGAVIVLRGGERTVGWLVLAVGVSLSFDALTVGWAGAYVDGRVTTLGRWACWSDEWVWIFLLGGIWVLLGVFPDGRPFGRTGRAYLGWTGLVVALLLTTRPFHGGRLDDYPTVATPLPAVPGLRQWADLVGTRPIGAPIVLTFVLAFATLFYRYARSDHVRRTQLRWIAWEAGVLVTILLLQQIPVLRPAMSIVSLILIPLLPVAITMAMFRERLWDIDRVISRTVSYGLLTGVLGALYAGVVTLTSTVAPDDLGSVGVAVATLLVAALFVPARRFLQRWVDRRFDRTRVSFRRVAEDFGRATRRDVDAAVVESDLLAAVGATVAPSHASVWLLPGPSASG